jgi:hypothetical protein
MQGPLLRTTTGFLSLLLAHSAAFALDVNIHGFLNAGLATHDAKKTTLTSLNATSTGFNTTQESPIYDGMVGRRPDADYLTSLGLQLDSPISDHLGITAQLVSDGGQTNDYKISSEWAFAKYRFNDNWSIRAGRLRNPAFLLSEYLKVGYATPWAQPPREVYWQMPGGLQNISGADVTYSNTLLNQDLNVTVFTGAVNTTFSLSGSPVSIKGNNALGTNITFGNEALTFRAGYETAEFKVNGSALQFIRDTLSASGGADLWSSFYYSPSVFIRATDGSIKSADLSPGISSRIAPLPVSGEDLKNHLELGLALRCIRRSSFP